MPLKYQKEIDSLKLSISCPVDMDEIKTELNVFRYSHNPLDLSIDFLPNVKYDGIMGITICDYSSKNKDEAKKCSRCGASFHKQLDVLVNRWDNMSPENKKNFGYNAIAEGILGVGDGLVKIGKSGHIGFYELDGASFHSNFKVIKDLV